MNIDLKTTFSILLCAITFYACENENMRMATDPTSLSVSDFQNPTGTLTASNINAVANIAVQSQNAFEVPANGQTPFTLSTKGHATDDITTCLSDEAMNPEHSDIRILGSCVAKERCNGEGSGYFEYHDHGMAHGADDTMVITYSNFNVNCGLEDSYTCNGSVSNSNIAISACYNLECDVNGNNQVIDTCFLFEEGWLITVEDESYTLTDSDLIGSCQQVELEIKDSIQTQRMTCDIIEALENCDEVGEVYTVSNCSFISS